MIHSAARGTILPFALLAEIKAGRGDLTAVPFPSSQDGQWKTWTKSSLFQPMSAVIVQKHL